MLCFNFLNKHILFGQGRNLRRTAPVNAYSIPEAKSSLIFYYEKS